MRTALTATRLPHEEPEGERKPVHVIEPRDPGLGARAREFWAYRQLLAYFGRRFIQKRYARTWLGRSWLFLRPVLDIGTRALVFGGVLGIAAGPAPYLVVFLVAASTWQLFAECAYWSTRSMELTRRELNRLYIPRLVPLVAASATALVEFLIYFGMGIIVVIVYAVKDGTFYLDLGPQTPLALLGLILVVLLGLSIGLWTAPYAVRARDVRFTLAYVLGFWSFLTPVIYPIDAIPEPYRVLANLNPVTAPIQMVKRGLLGFGDIPLGAVGVTLGVLAILVGGGLYFFGRHERTALDGL